MVGALGGTVGPPPGTAKSSLSSWLDGEEGCTATATDTASLVELDGNDGGELSLSSGSGCGCTSTLLTLTLDFEDDV